MSNLREQANRARQLPLTDVASYLGGARHSQDKQRWDFQNCAVWIGKGENGHRFYDHHTCQGGGGAIDLTMYVLGCSFKHAIGRLNSLTGDDIPLPNPPVPSGLPANEPDSFSLPKAYVQHHGIVFDYLTNTRGLPVHVVELVMAAGDVYADSRRNATFVCRAPNGHVTGAELRGTGKTPYKGMAVGSRRGIGFFMVTHPTPIELVVVESALDALAYQALFTASAATIISTAGVVSTCPALVNLANHLGVTDIVIAYDSDVAGDKSAELLMASLKGGCLTVRRRVPCCKDWNDILLHIGDDASEATVLADDVCQSDLFTEVG